MVDVSQAYRTNPILRPVLDQGMALEALPLGFVAALILRLQGAAATLDTCALREIEEERERTTEGGAS